MKRTPMPDRVTPLVRAGFQPGRMADVITLSGGARVLPFPSPKRPKDTTTANAWRLVNAILEDRTAPKRAPLKAVSDKRARQNRQRTAMADRLYPDRREGTVMCTVPDCGKPADDLNEILSRARGGSITDENNVHPCCRQHNEELTKEPEWGYRLGFLKHSWGDNDGGDAA